IKERRFVQSLHLRHRARLFDPQTELHSSSKIYPPLLSFLKTTVKILRGAMHDLFDSVGCNVSVPEGTAVKDVFRNLGGLLGTVKKHERMGLSWLFDGPGVEGGKNAFQSSDWSRVLQSEGEG